MAIFQFQMQVIKRSDGRSVVSAAAYRSAETIENRYTGLTDDYSRKEWVVSKEILLPEHAPPAYQDRAVLWNAVEQAEKGRNARLAREIEVALPQELSMEENIALIRSFAEEFRKDGMVVDICIHNPPLRDNNGHFVDNDGNRVTKDSGLVFRNPHAHLLLTVRPLDEDGNWMPKTQKEYICKRGNETASFTAGEYRKAKGEGWEKIYQYWHGKEKVWKTPSEAFAENLVRISPNPRSSLYGRRDAKTEFWNSPDALIQYRKSWEMHVNQALEAAGRPERVDCRSYEAQGVDDISGIHLGSYAARHPETGAFQINEDIKSINRKNKKLQETIDALDAQIRKTGECFYEKLAEQLGSLEARLAEAAYQVDVLEDELLQLQKKREPLAASVGRIRGVQAAVLEKDHASKESIDRLQATLPEARFAGRGAFQKAQAAIQAEQDAVEFRRQRFSKVLKEEGFSDLHSFHEAERLLAQMEHQCQVTEETLSAYKEKIQEHRKSYEQLCQYLPGDDASMAHFRERRQHWTDQYTQKAAYHLHKSGRPFRADTFRRVALETSYYLNHTFYLAGQAEHFLHQAGDFADRQLDGRCP